MIRRTTWILLALFVVLLGVLLYTQRVGSPGGADSTPVPTDAPLFNTGGQAIDRLAIESAEGERVEVARGAEGGWTLVEPAGQPADEARIESAITQAEGMRITSELENPPEPQVVGLDPARYLLTVTFAEGQEQVVMIGDETPTRTGTYARLEGGPVVVIEQAAAASLTGLLETPPTLPTPTNTVAPTAAGTGTQETSGSPTPETTATP